LRGATISDQPGAGRSGQPRFDGGFGGPSEIIPRRPHRHQKSGNRTVTSKRGNNAIAGEERPAGWLALTSSPLHRETTRLAAEGQRAQNEGSTASPRPASTAPEAEATAPAAGQRMDAPSYSVCCSFVLAFIQTALTTKKERERSTMEHHLMAPGRRRRRR